MVSAVEYPSARVALANKEIDWDTDAIKLALLTASYTPADTHDYFNDVVANEVSGTGYTAGGVTLGTKTSALVDDGSATARANSTAYVIGDVVRPSTANGHLYMAVVAGTSHTSAPTFGTAKRRETAEGGGTVVWAECGRAMATLGSAAAAWTGLVLGAAARYGVIYDSTPGTDATRPLIAYIDLVTDRNNTDLTITPSGGVWLRSFADFAS